MFLRPVLSTLGKRIASPLACRSNSTVPESKRGNVYELRTYTILPSKMREYQKVVEEVLPVRMKQSQLNGSWYTEIGNLNEVFYLWEYDSVSHRTKVRKEMAENEEWRDKYLPKLLSLVSKQVNALLIPFSWYEPRLDPVKGFGVYELVIHDLNPGMLSQFEHIVQQGLPARMKYDYPKPIGLWYTEFGHGSRVVSIYPHVSLEEREIHRRGLMSDEEWRETWKESMKFIRKFTVKAMTPSKLSLLQ